MPGEETTTTETVVETPVVTTEPSLMDAPPEGETQAEETTTEETQVEEKAEPTAEEIAAEDARRAALTDEERAAEDKAKETGEDKPIEYTDFAVPEGVELNEDLLGELTGFAKERKLSQEETQALVDMGVKLQQNQNQAFADAQIAARAEWRDSSLTDGEFGGAAFKANMPIAVAARDKFGTPELKELLDVSGLGDHPEVIRFFYRVGKVTGEHNFVAGDRTSVAKSFYDHPTSKPKG